MFGRRILALTSMLVSLATAAMVRADDEQADEAVRRALEQKVTVDAGGAPLREVLQTIAANQGIRVLIDRGALNDAGLDPMMPVTFQAADVSLRVALRSLLKELDLTWLIEEGVLMITTVDEASQQLRTKVYDVNDLVKSQKTDTVAIVYPDMQPLVEVIRAIVAPTTWSEVGGPATIKPFQDMLVVSQTDFVHEEIEKLLSDLRKTQAKREQGQARPAAAGRT